MCMAGLGVCDVHMWYGCVWVDVGGCGVWVGSMVVRVCGMMLTGV